MTKPLRSLATPADFIRQEADLLAVGVKVQNEALDLLLTEMRALAALMPGDSRSSRDEGEIEAGFDNMPI